MMNEHEAAAHGDSQIYTYTCTLCGQPATAPDPNIKRAKEKVCKKCWDGGIGALFSPSGKRKRTV